MVFGKKHLTNPLYEFSSLSNNVALLTDITANQKLDQQLHHCPSIWQRECYN